MNALLWTVLILSIASTVQFGSQNISKLISRSSFYASRNYNFSRKVCIGSNSYCAVKMPLLTRAKSINRVPSNLKVIVNFSIFEVDAITTLATWKRKNSFRLGMQRRNDNISEDLHTLIKKKSKKITYKTKNNKPTLIKKKSKKITYKTKDNKPQSRSQKLQEVKYGSKPPDENWESIYALVQELRADKTAPVDYDGGEVLSETNRGEVVYRFQVLIALMLSSQTKDSVVGEAMKALQKHGLEAKNILNTSDEKLNSLIQKVGFHNNKTKYIKATCQILVDKYSGDIPPTVEEMLKLPGVGPKMAYIVENVAFGRTTGIGVDTHMHRMFNELHWVNTKTPEKTRQQLERWLPREKWSEVNYLWVGFGQELQQQKEKTLRKALSCSKPVDALELLKRLGMDCNKWGKKYGLVEEINMALKADKNIAKFKKEDLQ